MSRILVAVLVVTLLNELDSWYYALLIGILADGYMQSIKEGIYRIP